jgi:hypothetical protein
MTSARTAVHPAGGTGRRPARRRPAARTGAARRRPARRPTAGRPPARKRKGKGKSKGGRLSRLGAWWPVLLVTTAVLVGLAWDTESTGSPAVSDICLVSGSSLTLTAEQLTNAVTIAGVAHDRGLPERAVVIALATAQQESRLRNLDYGDRDSLGLFQQRPSQGWGTEAQVQDPAYAAGKFYDHLMQVPGWDTGRLTDVAQAVQRSGFPEAYQQWEPMATELTAVLVAKPTGAGVIDCP